MDAWGVRGGLVRHAGAAARAGPVRAAGGRYRKPAAKATAWNTRAATATPIGTTETSRITDTAEPMTSRLRVREDAHSPGGMPNVNRFRRVRNRSSSSRHRIRQTETVMPISGPHW